MYVVYRASYHSTLRKYVNWTDGMFALVSDIGDATRYPTVESAQDAVMLACDIMRDKGYGDIKFAMRNEPRPTPRIEGG